MSYKLPIIPPVFPVWCQGEIPLTFDNSESYLEFVAHINAKLNEVIKAINAQNLAFNDIVNIINETIESFKTYVENEIAENKTEILNALDDLRTELTNRISAVEDDVEALESDVSTLKKESGDISVFTEKTTTVDYTMEIESANCNIYYKNPNSDIWHEHATDTTINDFITNETAESVGNKDFLFLFSPPAGYPEEQFVFSAGTVVTATGATSEDSAAAIYSRETIPTEDFNAGLVLYANGVVTTDPTPIVNKDTVVITNTDEVQNYSCLYMSNNFVLGLLQPLLYSFTVSVSEVFGTLYSEKTGQNVSPRIKINETLAYDSNGVLGAVSALPATLPDNLLYFGAADSVTADAYSLIFNTECVIYENYSDDVTQNSWKKYPETTLREFLPNYVGWLNPSTGSSKNLYVFFKEMTFPNGFKFLSGADGIETGYTGINQYFGTWVDFGHSDTLPSLADIPSFVRLYKDTLSLIGNSTHYSRTADNWSMTIPHDRAKFAYIYGNAFFFRSLKTTLLNGGGRSDTWYITTPSITYHIIDEESNPVKISLAIDDTLQNPQGVLGVSDSLTDTINNIPSALAAKQGIIDSNNKLSADLVDDSTTTNKFATAEDLAQIATNTGNISTLTTKEEKDRAALVELVDGGAKNLFNPAIYTVVSTAGVTVTPNADGTYTLSGAASGSTADFLYTAASVYTNMYGLQAGGTYTIVSGDDKVLIRVDASTSPAYQWNRVLVENVANEATFTIPDNVVGLWIRLRVPVASGNVDNVIVTPMICTKAAWNISNAYQPYRPSYQELYERVVALENA